MELRSAGVARQPLQEASPPTSRHIIEPAAHLVNPPHRLAVGREQQDGAVVDGDIKSVKEGGARKTKAK
jgi:hypothetical protein